MSRNPAPATASAPGHLSLRARGLWEALVPRRARSPERLALLQLALEQLDIADAARAQALADGLTFATATTGAVHAHPALAIERQARSAFFRIWTKLGLDWDSESDGGIKIGPD